MSKGWERFFFIFSYITQGSSYLSPWAYGVMHRMHHAYTDTDKDPHSPSFDKSIFSMMWRTKKMYSDILHQKVEVEAKFTRNVPSWRKFDLWANSTVARILWIAAYIWIYIVFAPSLWWFWLLPVHIAMGPVHGAIINWFAHKYGKVNFVTDNTSKNLFKLDLLMMGEGYHNNHHNSPSKINFAAKRGEFDFCYPIIKLLAKFKVIKINRIQLVAVPASGPAYTKLKD